MNQFKAADGELIQSHILILLDAGDAGDMADLGVLCLFEIYQDGSSGDDTTLQMVYAKALQVLHIEVTQQLLLRGLVCEHPVVELEGEELCAEEALEVLLAASVEEHFLRRETAQEFLYIVCCSLASEELTSGDIEEGDTKRGLAEVDGREEVILFIVEDIV